MGRRQISGDIYQLTADWRDSLRRYLAAEGKGSARRLAAALRVSPSAISLLATRTHSSDLCDAIAKATAGAVPVPAAPRATADEAEVAVIWRRIEREHPEQAKMLLAAMRSMDPRKR